MKKDFFGFDRLYQINDFLRKRFDSATEGTPERYGQVTVTKWGFKLMDSSKIYAKGKRATARVNLYLTLYLRTVRVTKWRRQKTEARVPLLDGNIRDSHPLWGNFSGENWSNFKSKQSQISKTKTRNGGNSPKTWDFRRPKRKFCMTWSPIWLNIFFQMGDSNHQLWIGWYPYLCSK